MSIGSYVKRMPWGQQKPPVGFGIDWSHPIASGKDGNKKIVGCWLFNQYSGMLVTDIAQNNNALFGVVPLWRNDAAALSLATNQRALIKDIDILNSSFTVIACASGGSDFKHLFGRHGSWRMRNNGLTPCFDVQTSVETIVNFGTSALLSQKRQMVGVRKDTSIEAYLNGKYVTQADITPPIANTNNTSAIGGYYAGTSSYQWDGSIYYIYVMNYDLSADGIASLYAEPYCFIEGWNYGRVYSIPSSAFINSSFWYQNPILEAI